jgi:hypothetical protein
MTRVSIACLLVAACAAGEPVSPPELGDYTSWYRIDTYGAIPGHGDSYRIIYVNDIARTRGTTEKDAVLVKEVHDDDAGQPGALREVAIMRKLRAGSSPDHEGGWLFSQTATPGGDELHYDLCWNRCHAQAPLAGVWLDYTK